MARSMHDFISSTNALLSGVDSHEEWMSHLDNVRDTRAQSMADYATRVSTEFDDRAKEVTARTAANLQEQLNSVGITLVPIDKVNYPKRHDLSGPYRYYNGSVLYFDPARRAYFDGKQNRHLTMTEAREHMGHYSSIFEDENRSDSEFAAFFDDRSAAIAAYSAAVNVGLTPGEVTYDPTVDRRYGVGQYAVRIAPHVPSTKPDAFYEFLDAVYDHVVEEDVDQFEWLMAETQEYLTELEAKRGGDLKKMKKKSGASGLPAGPYNGNPFHDSPVGKFTALRRLPTGSFSNKGEYLAARKNKKGMLQFTFTKLPCGRKARGKGTGKNFGRRCWDGKIPAWASGGEGEGRKVIKSSVARGVYGHHGQLGKGALNRGRR